MKTFLVAPTEPFSKEIWARTLGRIVQRSRLGQILRRHDMHFNLEIAVRRYLSHEAVSEQS